MGNREAVSCGFELVDESRHTTLLHKPAMVYKRTLTLADQSLNLD
jgi:hypothetical protein